jgi:hypothetical protein
MNNSGKVMPNVALPDEGAGVSARCRDVAGENDIGRSQGVNASLTEIYLALGLRRR